jgi:hypothetical protein
MQVNQFLDKQTNLGITNSVLTSQSKINETLLDAIYDYLQTIKNKPNMVCNVIFSKVQDENNVNIQMSGNSADATTDCYKQLSYVFTENKNKFTGVTMTSESDSYKITITPAQKTETTATTTDNKTTTTNTSTLPSTTPSQSDSSLKNAMDKLFYSPLQDKVQNEKPTTESNEYSETLLEEIKRIKNIMYI